MMIDPRWLLDYLDRIQDLPVDEQLKAVRSYADAVARSDEEAIAELMREATPPAVAS